MTEDNEKKLLNTFPDLFITDGVGLPKFGGFECGNGWYELIYEMSKEIQNELDEQFGEESRIMYAIQVKEKYGTLRFYMNESTPEINIIIDDYEMKSSKTCEVCGKPGKTRDKGWIQTLCDEHN